MMAILTRFSNIFIVFFVLSGGTFASAADGSLHYEGELKDSFGTPLSGVYLIRFAVYIDNNSSCEVYRGDYTPTITAGKFQVKIGSATNRVAETIAPGFSLRQVMSNAVSANFGTACAVATNSTRTLKVFIDEDNSNTFSGPELASPFASMELGSAATAMEAEMLQGKTKADFAQINTGANLTQSNLENIFSGTSYSKLMDLISGTSQLYTHTSDTSGTKLQIATPGVPVSAPVAGSIWYDSVTGTVKYYNGTITQTLSSGAAGLTSVGLSLPAMFNVAGSPLTANGSISATLANQNPNLIFAGPSTGGAAAPSFRSLVENDIPNLTTAGKVSGSAINAGTIGGSTAISTTGAISTTTDITTTNGDVIVSGAGKKVSASVGVFRQTDLLDSGSNKIPLKSPAVVGTSYTFTLPADKGINTYLLQTDGNGTTSWVAPAIGGDFFKDGSVAMTGSLKMGGNQIYGNSTAGGSLVLESTSNATKGKVLIQPTSGVVGMGTTNPDQSAVLELASTSRGFIVPRMTQAQRDTIVSPATGLQVYNTSTNALNYYNGSSWTSLGASGGGLTNLNGLSDSAQSFANGVGGLQPNFSSAGGVHTLNIPMASGAGVTSGTISKADYDTFTAKITNAGGTPSIQSGTLAGRPASGVSGRLYVATDMNQIYRDTGISWDMLSPAPSITGSYLTSGKIWLGNVTNQAAEVSLNGDVTMNNSGAATISNSAVTTAKIANNAITTSKMFPPSPLMKHIVSASGAAGETLGPLQCGQDEYLMFNLASGWECYDFFGTLDTYYFTDGGNDFATTSLLGNRTPQSLQLITDNTPRVTIDSIGKVGIGTTNPPSRLTVAQQTSGLSNPTGAYFLFDHNSGLSIVNGIGLSVATKSSGTSSYTTATAVNVSLDNAISANMANGYGQWVKVTNAGTMTTAYGQRITLTNSGSMTNSYGLYVENPLIGANHYSIFSAAGKSYFAGDVGLGTTTPAAKLHVKNGDIFVEGTGATCSLGNMAGGVSCASDVRLKKNIQPIENAIDKFLNLRGVYYDWNELARRPGAHAMGVIAQEVEKEFPEAVETDKITGFKRVDYSVLISPAIESIRYLKNKNDQLEERIRTLEQNQLEDREKINRILQQLENK